MESINDRFMLIIKEFELNKNSFGKKIGVSSSAVIENIVAGRRSKPSFGVIEKVLFAFENINARWLITGEGEMIINTDPPSQKIKIEETTETHKSTINNLEETVELQKMRIENLNLLVESKNQTVNSQEKTIETLERQIQILMESNQADRISETG